MPSSISSSELLEKLDSQHQVRRVFDGVGENKLAHAYDVLREQFANVIRSGDGLHNKQDLQELCDSLDEKQRMLLSGRAEKERTGIHLEKEALRKLRTKITEVRHTIRRQILEKMGWKKDEQDLTKADKLNPARRAMNVSLYGEDEDYFERSLAEIPESVRNAYRFMIEELDLDPALLTHLFALTNSNELSENRESTATSILDWVGKCQIRSEPAIPNIPASIFIAPELGFFRKIFFNALRDKYFPLFNQAGGLQTVERALLQEIDNISVREMEEIEELKGEKKKEKQHEYAMKRRFIRALIQYFKELESMPHPSRLKNSLGGREPFPNRYQQAAIFETSLLGKYFNATEMGGGKTGYAIGFFEYMKEQRDEKGKPKAKRAIILCPSGIVKIWQERLSDLDGGYFRKGQAPKVAIMNGDPGKRREQWEAAKKADYVVMGIEMSRGGTECASHEDLLRELGADTLIVDEVHNAKNVNGKDSSDTERIYRISQSPSLKYRLLLSGTPIPNHRRDIAAQLRLLHADAEVEDQHIDSSIEVFEAFIENAPVSTADARIIARQDIPPARNGLGSINFHDVGHLTKMIEGCDTPITQHYLLPYLYRIRAKDCLPVEAKLLPIIEDRYDLTPEERMHYNNVLEDDSMGLMQKLHQLRRICLHPNAMQGARRTGASKRRRMEHWIDTFMREKGHSGKIVVTDPDYKRGVTKGDDSLAENLFERYAKEGIPIFILDGDETGNQELKEKDIDGTPMTKTKKIIARFRDHQGPAILLAQMDTVREGIDLSFVSRAIQLSPAWTRSEEDQFWRRFYRRGQLHDVKCVKLMAKNTIEEGKNVLSLQKYQLGERLLNGRKLTDEELTLLDSGSSGGAANPNLWWVMLPPKEQLKHLWGRLMHAGKNTFHKAMDRWGETFARLYNLDWETSYNGNMARVVAAILGGLQESGELPRQRGKTNIADIASGAFALERTLLGRSSMQVWSTDINPHMISEEMGTTVLRENFSKRRAEKAAMDQLPYADCSKEVAVLSLGLHYAMHRDKPKREGKERIRTVCEANRILSRNGIAIVTFPPSVFRGRMKQKYEEMSLAFRHCGFEIIPEYSDRVRALKKEKNEKSPFEAFVFTLRKTGKPVFHLESEWDELPEEVRKGFDLSKVKKVNGKPGKKVERRKRREIHVEEGVYHDSFVLGSGSKEEKSLSFKGNSLQEKLKKKVELKKILQEQCPPQVATLLGEYQTLDDIEPQRWMDVALDSLAKCPQEIKDQYAQALLTRGRRDITKGFLASLNANQKHVSVRLTNGGKPPSLVMESSDGAIKKYPFKKN